MSLQLTENDHYQGTPNAPIILVEYADYQCPYCKDAYFIVKKIEEQLGKDLGFVFRNFPLREMHPNAFHAAMAAESAGDQGRFWEMHDMLYENQNALEDADLIEYAKKLNLDIVQFEKDFSDKKHYQKIKNDMDSGMGNHVQGTPTFFINGKIFEGNWMSREFVKALQSFL